MVGAMNYWLVKSEPSSWSWDQQVAKGAKGEAWTGVRNFTARQNLVNMKKGDRAFFYHSNEGKDIVEIAEVIKEAYPDPTDKTGKFVCVDLRAHKPLKTPVTMAAIKADKRLSDMALVKYSRLSGRAGTPDEWKIACRRGGVARTASRTCLRRPRALAAGEIRDSDSSNTADAISVRKAFSEILMPAISRRKALTWVVETARRLPELSRYWNIRLPGRPRR